MAITKLERTQIEKVFIAFLNAAPSITYLDQLVGYAGRVDVLAKDLAQTDSFKAIYPSFLTNEEFAAKFVANFIGSTASVAAKAYVSDEVVKSLNAGVSRGDTLFNVVVALQSVPDGDATFGNTKKAFENKVAVADYYAVTKLGSATDLTTLQNLVAGVTDSTDVSTPVAIETAIAKAGATNGQSSALTVGADQLTGTANNDTFTANVVQNVNGEHTNQLATGDKINGGAGTDTLVAVVQQASALNNSPSQAITPTISDVEHLSFTALTVGSGDPETVIINAKNVIGVDSVGSVQSDASLLIENLTTLTDSGLYADRRATDSITIRFDHSGNGKAVDPVSNLSVLFDNDYLIAQPPSTSTKTFWWLLDQKSDLAKGKPLAHIDSDGLSFTINGVASSIFIPKAVFDTLDGSYEAFVGALNAQIAATPALAGYSVTLDNTNARTVALADGSKSVSIPAIVLNAPEGVDVTSTGFHHYVDATGSYDVFGNIADAPIVTTEKLVTSNIELFKVGRGAEGGSLTVGAQNTGISNFWNYSRSALKEGVEQFNVTVFGDNTQFSDLASLQSTNNTLRVVNVVTDAAQTGKYADLLIHNLKDVQTFDASAFKGNLTLAANLTNEVTAKYLDLIDQAPAAAAADNVAFQYKGGLGNDKISLELDESNVAAAGTATREDFSLNIDGGAGNDTLTLRIGDQVFLGTGPVSGQPLFQNWYDNQVLNANLSINGGAGDDTITKPGSGNVVIDAGTGNDTVYADNIGNKAVWAFNVENSVPAASATRYQLNNLQSDANDSYKLFNAKLTVNFDGFAKQVDIVDTRGLVSDLAINQAIKKAINSDAVLSKLLLATDGPGNTLVVTSLVDGSSVVSDLKVSVQAPTTLTTAEALQVNGYYGTSVDATTLLANFASQVVAFNTAADYASTFARNGGDLSGSNSVATSDNLITGGLGNDVLALGTGAYSNDGVKYVGYENGKDSIVHFETGADGFVYDGGTAEQALLTFIDSDGTPAAQTIVFDGVTVTLSSATAGVIPALDIAHQFVTQYNAASATNHWTAVEGIVPGTVVLINDANGNVADLTSAAFTGTYVAPTGGAGSVTVGPIVQGTDIAVPATSSTFTVTYNDATTAAAAGTTITLGTAVAAIAANDGSLTIAEQVATLGQGANIALSGYIAGPVVHTATGDSVTFTAVAPGAATALPTAAAFKVGSAAGDLLDGILGSFTGTLGTDATTTAPVLVNTATGIDYLDFTAYKATAVIVNGAAVVGSLPTTGVYISLVESATNAGEYTISEYNLGTTAAATDDVVNVIGVADFGQYEVFNAANFHI